jgi:hypothetical protein
MIKNEEQKRQVIPFVKEFNTISIYNLDEILEQLQSWGYLNEKGLEFRHEFWKLLIKK